jgi:hypothetical protein
MTIKEIYDKLDEIYKNGEKATKRYDLQPKKGAE